jgi:acyl-CoA synthetase (AMP-forming)/AMP-acid ligase II
VNARLRRPERGIPDEVRAVRAAIRATYAAGGLHCGRTLAAVLDDGARAHWATTLRFHSDARPSTVTLAEVQERARSVASGLHALGLRPGDAIAIQLPNWAELAVSYWAAAQLGAVIVPIVPIYGPAEVGFILRQSRARAYVFPATWRSTDFGDILARSGSLPDLEHAIVVGEESSARSVRWEALERTPPAALPALSADADAVCMVVYTSGTTADPKGVQHTHNSVIAEMRWSPTPPPAGPPDTVSLQPFPPGHTAGVIALLGAAVHGFATILMDGWDADVAVELIERHRVTALAGTPFFLAGVLDASERLGWAPTRSVRDVVTGGAGVPPVLVERGEAAGWTVCRVYGSTEQPSTTGSRPADPLGVRATTDGFALTGSSVVIVDERGAQVPMGVDGEIVVNGPDQFLAYTDADLNRTAFTVTGLFRTGDVGHVDDRGALVVTDRIKDVIIRGGENISSRNVEDALARHPGVAEAAVTGLRDERYGERVGAFVVLRPGQTLDLDEVQRHFRELGVARQKTPERLVILDSLPHTAAGKVKKHELRRLYDELAVEQVP